MNESRHTCGWVMSHMWMGHVTHVDGSCHVDDMRAWEQWNPPPQVLRMRMDVSCHTYGCVMSHVWMGHVTHVDGSCHTCG